MDSIKKIKNGLPFKTRGASEVNLLLKAGHLSAPDTTYHPRAVQLTMDNNAWRLSASGHSNWGDDFVTS